MRFFIHAIFLLASCSLWSFVVEDDFLIQEEMIYIPGDVIAIEHSPELSLYCRIAEEINPSAWEPFRNQDLAFSRVQFALKLENTTLNSFNLLVKTHWQFYVEAKVQSRTAWGARAAINCLSLDLQKNQFALHHSDTGVDANAKILRTIQHDHMTRRAWPDIGYHFLIGRDGLCYEGRKLCFKGSHVKHCNKGNIGICLLGCFEETEENHVEPTLEMLETLTDLIATLALHFGIELRDTSVRGHKHFKDAQTLCPGNFIVQRLNAIIEQAIAKKFDRLGHL